MSAAKDSEKEYDTATVITRAIEALSKIPQGQLPSNVFQRPHDSSTYDSIAATARMQQQGYINGYSNLMMMQPQVARTAAVSASLGLGSAGVSLLNGMRMLSPDAADAFMGHHGASQATALLLQGANGIALARGTASGGILNPKQLDRNMMFAASQGALAFKNNFTNAGAIDVSQTRGLSLEQAAAISSGLLSNRSNYTDWADKTMAKYSSLSEKDKPIKDLEVTRFRDGIGASDKAQLSFNEHIKKMSKEINGFVSTVSKMTGNFEEAIEFMQKATGGKLYASGEEADKLRQRAVKMAAGMRAIAADAGYDASELFQMSSGFEDVFNAGRGTTLRDATSTALGVNLAGAFGKWKAQNPNASQYDQGRAAKGLQDRAESYAQGDSEELNAIAGYLVNAGKISMEEARKAAGTNNADDMYRLLVSKLGKDGVASLRGLPGEIAALRHENQAVVSELDSISSTQGQSMENVRVGTQNRINASRKRMESMLVNDLKSSGMSRDDVEKEFREGLSAAFSSNEALGAAGLSSEKAAEISEKAKKDNWSESRIRREVADAGGDVDELTRVGQDRFLKDMAEKHKDNNAAMTTIAAARKDYDRVYGGEITERDIELAKKDLVLKENLSKRQGVMARAQLADTEEKRNASKAEVKELMTSVLGNENGSAMEGDVFLDELFGQVANGADAEENAKIVDEMKTVYKKARAAGMTQEEALSSTRNNAVNNSNFASKLKNIESLGLSEEELKDVQRDPNSEKSKEAKSRVTKSREAALDAARRKATAVGIIGEYTQGKDVSDETRQSILADVEAQMRDLKTQNPDLDDSILVAEAVKAAVTGRGVDFFKKLEDGNGGKNDLESIIGNVKEDRSLADDKYHKYGTDAALTWIADDQKSAADASKGRNFNRKDLESRARLNKRLNNESIGYGINQSSRASAESGANVMLTNGTVMQAKEAMEDSTTTSLIEAADYRDAKEANKTIGDFNASQLRYYNRQFKIDENMSTVEDAAKKLLDAANGSESWRFKEIANSHTKDGKVDETEIREPLMKFMREHEGDSAKEFDKALTSKFGAGIRNAFFKGNDDENGKARVAAFLKGAGKSGDDRNKAMREGYMMQKLADEGGPSKAPPEILNYLLDIKQLLSGIKLNPIS